MPFIAVTRKIRNWWDAQPPVKTQARKLAIQLRHREDQLFMVLTLVIGAVVGLTIVAFISITDFLTSWLYPLGAEAQYRTFVIPAVGALFTGVLLFRFFPDARGSGIPQTKVALVVHGGRITLRTVLGKFWLSVTSLASGIALGREGPSVQIGAGIASVMGRALGLKRQKVESLIPVGASAALAAAFNTPIAAVLFSLEEVMGNLHAPLLGSVVLASATSWLVLNLVLGDEALFSVPEYQLVAPSELVFYVLLGVVGGLVSVFFVRLLLRIRQYFIDMPERTRWAQPVIGGLTVGILGFFVPEVLGVGYGRVGDLLNGSMEISVRGFAIAGVAAMVILMVLKLVATATCYGSGNAGGIFGPSLFIGAMLGGIVGTVANMFFPESTGPPGAYALVGMGTAFAGIIRVPFTSVIMIFELTRDYSIIVPLMLSNMISYFIAYRLQPKPIYEALAEQDGIHLPTAATQHSHGRLRVRRAMRVPTEVLEAGMTPRQARERIQNSPWAAWPVIDERGLVGMITAAALRDAEISNADGVLVEVAGVRASPHLHDDHLLDLALERMGAASVTVLPVVSRLDVRRLEAIVGLDDVMRVYGFEEHEDE
jgi:CIC family chloride channel protein